MLIIPLASMQASYGSTAQQLTVTSSSLPSAAVPSSNLRQLFLHHTAAHGPMHARHLCERLYGGQDCFLQIDSHMRFTPHWDTQLLDALYAAAFLPALPDTPPPSVPRRCLITGYPSDYDVDSPASAPLSPSLSIMTASHFASDGLLRIKARPLLLRFLPSLLSCLAGFDPVLFYRSRLPLHFGCLPAPDADSFSL